MSTVTVGDVQLYYEEHGSGDPLLLIMGLATDSTAWIFQLPAFAERYRTITFDNRGVGRSASSCAIMPPIETPTTCVRSMPSAASRPAVSSAMPPMV